MEECPYCHKFFAAEQISKDEVDSNISRNPLAPEEAARIATRYTRYYDPGLGHTRYQDVITYQKHYRCKHCGKEWTKMSEKVLKVPGRYIPADESQVAREEEKAKEEQYAREE